MDQASKTTKMCKGENKIVPYIHVLMHIGLELLSLLHNNLVHLLGGLWTFVGLTRHKQQNQNEKLAYQVPREDGGMKLKVHLQSIW